MRSKKSFFTLGIIVLVLFLGVGYAVVSSVYLNIGGTASVANADLKVEITNVVASTNIADKTLNFTNQLSNKNLDSNFTLNGMELNEKVTITYTVTNNETDVDAEIKLASGVELTNSNADFFDVNYTIPDSVTDLASGDKTMEVVVTVELVQTPVTEEEGTTTVGLKLAAIPKGGSESTGTGSDSSNDILDNEWPIEWNTMEVVNNTADQDGILVKISNLTPSFSELQLGQLKVDGSDEEWPYMVGIEFAQGCMVVYGDVLIISAPIAGEYEFDDDTIYISNPGLYTLNFGNDNFNNMDFNITLEKRDILLRFDEKYYLTSFWEADTKEYGRWITFYEDGTAEKYDLTDLFPLTGYSYSETKIINPDLGFGENVELVVSQGGNFIYIMNGETIVGILTIEYQYNGIKDLPLKFGQEYDCTVDNVNSETDSIVGAKLFIYIDGSGKITYPDGSVKEIPKYSIEYSQTEITGETLGGDKITISEDGNTLTVMDGENILYVYELDNTI